MLLQTAPPREHPVPAPGNSEYTCATTPRHKLSILFTCNLHVLYGTSLFMGYFTTCIQCTLHTLGSLVFTLPSKPEALYFLSSTRRLLWGQFCLDAPGHSPAPLFTSFCFTVTSVPTLLPISHLSLTLLSSL